MKIKQISHQLMDEIEIEISKGGLILDCVQPKSDMDIIIFTIGYDERVEKLNRSEKVKIGIYTINGTIPNGSKYLCKISHPYYNAPRFVFEISRTDVKKKTDEKPIEKKDEVNVDKNTN